MQINKKFWEHLQTLVNKSKIIIDRPKGTQHPKYPDLIYEVDYGYLENTSSMDGQGIDVFVGTENNQKVNGIAVIVDLIKKDSEIKILIGCNADEKEKIRKQFTNYESLQGIVIEKEDKECG